MSTSPTSTPPSSAEQACREGELALLTGAVRGDLAAARDLLHEDFTELGQSGRAYTRSEILAHLTEDAVDIAAEDLRETRLSDDVVLVQYVSARDGARPGEPGRANRTSVWVRGDDGRWRMRHHHGTPTAYR